jgi:protein TIF31
MINERFRYVVPSDDWKKRKLSLLRSICMKVGIQMEAKAYNFDAALVFTVDDILNIYPVVKHAPPQATFAENAFEHGRLCLAQNEKKLGEDILREALSMQEQIYGPVHPETGRSYGAIAMHYFSEKDYTQAIAFQRRAVIVCERSLGVDDAETLQQYNNLAYFEHVAGNPEVGLELMLHSYKLGSISHQFLSHPEAATAFSNTGTMLQTLNEYPLAVNFHEEATLMNFKIFGAENQVTVSGKEFLVQSLFLNSEYRKALLTQKDIYNYYKKRFGDDDERTKQQSEALGKITQKAVEFAKLKKFESQQEV